MPAIPELTDALDGGHVSLRLAAERDIPEVLIAHQEDPRLAAALGLARPPSGAQLGRMMEAAPGLRRAGTAVTFTIVAPASDDCRGQIHADRFDWEHAHADLRIWVAPDGRGRGLGRRALALAAAWLIEACALVRVQILCAPANEAAIHAALGAGFTREGVLRAHVRAPAGRTGRPGGRGHPARADQIILSRIASDPPPR